ncbi:brassinosteroid insensitive 1-associated receptor kinase 1, partial [Phtheirospermum japonicum]
GDALYALREVLDDPQNALSSWDNGLETPSTWFHITWNYTTNGVERVEVYDNKIDGSIPKELGNLGNLVSLDLYGNSLTGSIPQELGNLKNLMFLRLYNNNLSGRVPDALANLSNLKIV